MRGIRNYVVGFAASVVMAGTVAAQDAFMWFNPGKSPGSASGISLGKQVEPTLKFGPNLQVTGLIVDCFAPTQAWDMFTPSASVTSPQNPLPTSYLPLLPADAITDPAVNHESTFIVLRLSFP